MSERRRFPLAFAFLEYLEAKAPRKSMEWKILNTLNSSRVKNLKIPSMEPSS